MTGLAGILAGIGPKLAAHVLLSFSALALGTLVALPLAVWSTRSQRVARISLGLASLVQTIPALALLALFFPLLLSLGRLTGTDIPALGFLPALMALMLYAMLPILRNAITARQQLDPAVLEAADAVGMTGAQKLRLVEAPLALPFVVAGIRTAAAWTIGAATLATMVGQPSLGDPIFAGLQIQDWSLVLIGCLASAALALSVDALIGQIQAGLARGQSWRARSAIGALAVGIAICIATVASPAPGADRTNVVIGAKNFSEQFILARLIGHRLTMAGYEVSYREGLGSSLAYKALAEGEIDVYVDYSGTLLANEMHRDERFTQDQAREAISVWAKANGGVLLAGGLGFENAYAFAMKEERARTLGIASLDDLAQASAGLTLGSDLEFLERPEWRSVRDAYDLRFGRTRSFAPSLMFAALSSDDADVISAFSSDGRIAADRLILIEDPQRALPGYEALLLVSQRMARDQRLLAALRPLIGAISVDEMRRANYEVDRSENKRTPDQAAEALACRLRLSECGQ